ncbi:unnamed protein product [Caenorhabditis brenneri]
MSKLLYNQELMLRMLKIYLYGMDRATFKRDVPTVSPPLITGLPDRVTRVYLGEELALLDPAIHECLERTILTLFHETQCDSYSFEHLNIENIDGCYAEANVPNPVEFGGPIKKKTKKKEEKKEEVDEGPPPEKWSIGNSVIFAFTAITTIGGKTEKSITLGITFTCYLLAGAKILSVYEPEMDFFKALYFNFVTLTTIALGDFVPKSFDYLFITLIYIGIGLALTTMAIEIAADLLKKLHYIGRKMENVGQAVVWFGGKKMTMKSLVKHLGDQFNIPEEELANFDMSAFVDNAIKVEKGEIATLRKPPTPPVVFRERAFSYSNLRKSSESALKYVDDNRVSKMTEPTVSTVILHETTRTIDTLHNLASAIRRDPSIPRLDLDVHYLTDMSAPTSFEEHYLRTYTYNRKQ